MFPKTNFLKITILETVSGGLNSKSSFRSQNLASHNIQDLQLILFFLEKQKALR